MKKTHVDVFAIKNNSGVKTTITLTYQDPAELLVINKEKVRQFLDQEASLLCTRFRVQFPEIDT